MERLGAKDRLILLSGNGFHSWQSEVHLDAWLRDQATSYREARRHRADRGSTGAGIGGSVDVGRRLDQDEGLRGGGGAIYLNVEGREAHGSVPRWKRRRSRRDREEAARLGVRAREDAGGRAEVRNHWARRTERAQPDLQVGFASGFMARRAPRGRDSAHRAGAIVPNTQIWYGDHATNAAADWLASRWQHEDDPGRREPLDVGPTVLSLVGWRSPRMPARQGLAVTP
jgi:predicted AlkP superfamily phosphohydrolase/phosphomutase